MTICLVIKCKDALVVAADSLSVSSGGSTSKYVNKIRVIQSGYLHQPVVVAGAGASAFIDKFIDRCQRGIESYCMQKRQNNGDSKYKVDIVDFAEELGESVVSHLYMEYVNNRTKEMGIKELGTIYDLVLLVCGATREGELRAFYIFEVGLSENIESYGTIGSGSSYANFFLRNLSSEEPSLSVIDACNLALHTVKAAEIMDRNVGGMVKITVLERNKTAEGETSLSVSSFPHDEERDRQALDEMVSLIKETGSRMRQVATKQPSGDETPLEVEIS
jgi:20S proteasome alpha/beta subunit